ncbi:MAG: hypothetical protein V3U98_00965 [Acidobacteriota bacterium]
MARIGSELKVALRRALQEVRSSAWLVVVLWAPGAIVGLASAAAWAGGWSETLRETSAGHQLGLGFDLMLISDLLRQAGPSAGTLWGWGWGAGASFFVLVAVLQGGAIQILLSAPTERGAASFGRGCGSHASAMIGLAGASLVAAAGCAALAWLLWSAAESVGLESIGSVSALLLRASAIIVPLLAFSLVQVVLELARLDQVGTRDPRGLLPLAMAIRFVARRPLQCLLLYAAASVAALALSFPGLALARAAGLLSWGWGGGIWAGVQLALLARWACRVGLWAGLGVLYGVVPREPR